jgi:Amt family ammonium transporter
VRSLSLMAAPTNPSVSLFYSGLVRKKSALSLLWLSGMATAVASLQWLLWGYSLTFSHTAGRYIGDLHNFGFRYVLGQPSVVGGALPDLLFALYHGVVAAIT